MYPSGASEPTVVYKERLPGDPKKYLNFDRLVLIFDCHLAEI